MLRSTENCKLRYRKRSKQVTATRPLSYISPPIFTTNLSASPVCSTEAFSPERGAREGATKVMIVVTDGESHDGEELPDALKECEERNITRYAIAVSGSDKCAFKRKYKL